MKRLLFLLLTSILAVSLVACGDGDANEQKKEVSKVEKQSGSDESSETGTDEGEEKSYDQVLIDSEIAKVTLEGISKIEDSTWDEEYHEIKMSIENKSDKTIVVQTDEVSIDGLMVTDNVFFSEDVAGGKKANGKLKIEMFDEELPPLDEELEMILKVIDEETYDTIEEEKINIEIK